MGQVSLMVARTSGKLESKREAVSISVPSTEIDHSQILFVLRDNAESLSSH